MTQGHREKERRYALIPDRLWDGAASRSAAGRAIVVHGETIAAVVKADALPSSVRTFRLPGCTAIPGLIDAHVHLCGWEGPAFLAAGVTTVQDTGNNLDWVLALRAAAARQPNVWPDILSAGAIIDGAQPIHKYITRVAATPDDMRRIVREEVERGVDALKFYVGLTPEALRAGCKEAHRAGKRALSHLGTVDAPAAVRAGVDEIMHLTGCAPAWVVLPDRQKEVRKLANLFRRKGTVLNSTFVIWDRLARPVPLEFVYDSRRRWVHPHHLRVWHDIETAYGKPNLGLQHAVVFMKQFIAEMHARGVRIIAGTDAPIAHLAPGFSLHDELAILVESGIRLPDALKMATSKSARALGLKDAGRIAPGMRADIAIFAGDPTKDFTCLAETRLTVHRGRRLTVDKLRRAFAQLCARPDDSPHGRLWAEHAAAAKRAATVPTRRPRR